MHYLLLLLCLLFVTERGTAQVVLEDYLIATDGSQYPWVRENYKWGSGKVNVNGEIKSFKSSNEQITTCLSVRSDRKTIGDDIVETFVFTNTGNMTLNLTDIEINTPFNDNYPDARTCLEKRFHTHVWAAGSAGYVNAMRMGAKAPHLGLVMIKGGLDGYSIYERGSKKGSSNFRGVIALGIESFRLKPGKSYSFSWRIFEHKGWDDFFAKVKDYGGIVVSAPKYVGEIGEKMQYMVSSSTGKKTYSYKISRTGDIRVPIKYKGKETYIELFGVSSLDNIVKKRADFIMKHQVYHAVEGDSAGMKREGAILPYDNASGQIYCNWTKDRNWSDANEGRERVEAGVFLALLAMKDKSYKSQLLPMLERYSIFCRTQLQDEDFTTWTDADKRLSRSGQKVRYYNYPWIAHLYFQMAELTGNRKYAEWGYGTMMKCYKSGGYKFYYIDVPVVQSIKLLKHFGLNKEAENLLAEYQKQAATYMQIGLNFPKSEVNYEQSIVVPSVNFLCEVAILMKDNNKQLYTKLMDYINATMPVIEAFGGRQPSSHLNDIAIRHWDGYWFGMPKQWGDTFPHYWSCITADCFMNYSVLTGDSSYRDRANNILLGNLSLFTEDGQGGAAFIYPNRVNGHPSHGLIPFANDQDAALMYLLKHLVQ